LTFNSPLRYPGGKNKLARFIATLCERNNISGHYVEPYAGGASVALYLLYNMYVKEITINDQDRAIYAFWHSVLNHTNKFCNRIKETEVNLENWYKYKKIQNRKKTAPLFELGFSTFFLNRTNHSGIIDGGMIGGKDQNGRYLIDCRFNKEDLIERIRRIKQHKDSIHISNLDAMDLIKKIQKKSKNENTIFYFDPPYYIKGPLLYMDHYAKDDHKKVAQKIRKIKNARWIVSYDNAPEIKKMYKGCKKKEYSLVHTAHKVHQGEEVLFFSNHLKVPQKVQLVSRTR